MLINIGPFVNALCLGIFKSIAPHPLNIFVNVALIFYRADAWYAAGAIEIHFTERWPADDHRRKGTDFPFRRV